MGTGGVLSIELKHSLNKNSSCGPGVRVPCTNDRASVLEEFADW